MKDTESGSLPPPRCLSGVEGQGEGAAPHTFDDLGVGFQLLYPRMPPTPENPNLKRRLGPARWVRPLSLLLRPWLFLLRGRAKMHAPLMVFQSYQIGDLFMALPALKLLASALPIRVVCRPDCAALLRHEGFESIPFDNLFFVKPNLLSLWRTWSAARNLRSSLVGTLALDFDADPRTALWLRLAGVRRAVSYQRPFASLFNALFPISLTSHHQAEKNLSVARGFLERRAELSKGFLFPVGASPVGAPPFYADLPPDPGAPWILSCWTRKPEKNWPLERWSEILEKFVAAHFPLLVLEPPDADAAFRKFKERWINRVAFLGGPLESVAGYVRSCSGAVTIDNFLGHMAGYYGKPVLWINGSSDPTQVLPIGSRITGVQHDPMPCRPCGHRCNNPDRVACLTRLNANEVWNAFEALREMKS